jgi:citrate lyase gamma subunit
MGSVTINTWDNPYLERTIFHLSKNRVPLLRIELTSVLSGNILEQLVQHVQADLHLKSLSVLVDDRRRSMGGDVFSVPEALGFILDALETNTSVEKLVLEDETSVTRPRCWGGDPALVGKLVQLLQTNKQIQSLTLSNPSDRELTSDLDAVIKAVVDMGVVTDFKFDIKYAGALQALVRGMATNHTIRVLHVDNNTWTADDTYLFSRSLWHNTTLENVHLVCHQETPQDVDTVTTALKQLLQHNRTLRRITIISYRDLTDETVLEICRVVYKFPRKFALTLRLDAHRYDAFRRYAHVATRLGLTVQRPTLDNILLAIADIHQIRFREAFAMGMLPRIAEESIVHHLNPEIVDMIMRYAS